MSYSESAWNVTDSISGGAKVILSATGGAIELQPPGSKSTKTLWYGGVGAGAGIGFKIPTNGQRAMTAFNEALVGTGMPVSGGLVLKNNKHGELSDSDFQGLSLLTDTAAGLMLGVTGFCMLIGVPQDTFASAVQGVVARSMKSGPIMMLLGAAALVDLQATKKKPFSFTNASFKDVLDHSKGMILIGSVGLQLGAGVSGYTGYNSWQTVGQPQTDQQKMEAVSQADYLF